MQERVEFANTLRGVAAFSVLISHYTLSFWAFDRSITASLIHAPELPLEQAAFPTYLLWLHTSVPQFSWGAFGVALFFLVSGFVIPFSLRTATGPSFLVTRFFRIVPLYVCGFSITLLSIWLVGRYFNVPWPFALRDVLVQYVPAVRDFMWLPSIDGIVWTLEVEMKFYVVCAVASAWFRRRSPLVLVCPVAIAAIGFLIDATADWSGNLVIYRICLAIASACPFLIFMFIGVAFHLLYVRTIPPELGLFSAAGLFFLFAMHQWQAQVLWTYAFAVIVFAFAATFPSLFRGTWISNFFADISYPLYVIHGVAGYASMRVLMDLGAPAWVTLALVTAGSLSLAWVLHIAVEKPTQQLGKRITAV